LNAVRNLPGKATASHCALSLGLNNKGPWAGIDTTWAGGVSTLAQPTKITETTLPQQALAHDPAKTMNDLSVKKQDKVGKPPIC
jgi:hypothetical protein